MGGKEPDVFLCDICRGTVGQRFQIHQPSVGSFFFPGRAVIVAVKDDALMLCDDAFQQVMQVFFKAGGLLQNIRILPERLGNCRVQHHIRPGDGLHGARHAELELVAGKCHG